MVRLRRHPNAVHAPVAKPQVQVQVRIEVHVRQQGLLLAADEVHRLPASHDLLCRFRIFGYVPASISNLCDRRLYQSQARTCSATSSTHKISY